MKKKNLKLFISSIIICYIPGLLGSLFTVTGIDIWYETLNTPAFNPPNWIFGPVWSVLYALMGVSLYFIWKQNLKNKKMFVFFLLHLIFNGLWSVLFFGLHNVTLAFVDIIILWIMIGVMIVWFYRTNKYSSVLLIPYWLWVSFASVLNFSILWLN